MDNMGRTDFTGGDHIAGLLEVGVKTAVEAQLQFDPLPFDCGQGGIDNAQIKGNRFFTEDMFAGCRRSGDELSVGIGAGANNDRIDGLIVKNNLGVWRSQRNLVIGRTFFGCIQKHVGYSYQSGLRNPVGQSFGVNPANPAGANESNIDLGCHPRHPFFWL
jgi:hypothetical protein